MAIEAFGITLKRKIIRANIVRPIPDAFLGCSHTEIENLRSEQKVEFLPQTYREFMLEMGRRAGAWLFYDAVYSCPYASSNKEDAKEILQKHNKKLVLPLDAFVFAVHPNDAFHFFLTMEHLNDPPVYYFHYNFNQFIKVGESFTSYLNLLVDELSKQLNSQNME